MLIFRHKLLLGAISLDLFAVLFSGATALLPVFAKDILHVGAGGLRLLRSAQGVGAVITALFLTQCPLRRHVGRRLFIAVGIFGLAVIVFGLSRITGSPIAAVLVLGACRHGQRLYPRHIGAAGDARCSARPRRRGRGGLHRRLQRTRHLRGRQRRRLARRGHGGAGGRQPHARRGRLWSAMFRKLRQVDRMEPTLGFSEVVARR